MTENSIIWSMVLATVIILLPFEKKIARVMLDEKERKRKERKGAETSSD